MRKWVSPWLFAMSVLALLFPPHATAQENALKVGIAPHSSARLILKLYQPLRLHLEQKLGTPVEIVTAPDFTEFARRALNNEYDIALTTGNQARMLQVDAGYIPLVTYKTEFKAIAIVARSSNIQNARDIGNKGILGLSPSSLVTQWGLNWLAQNGLDPSTVRYVSAADSVAQLLLAKDAAVGFISDANFRQLPPHIQPQLRVIASSNKLIGRVYMLNKRLAPYAGQFESALFSFAKTAAGESYFAQYNLGGYRKLSKNELVVMEPYANKVREVLRTSK